MRVLNLLVCGVLLLAWGCASPVIQYGRTMADDALRDKTIRLIGMSEKSCRMQGATDVLDGTPRIVKVETQQLPRTDFGAWQETWTVQRVDGTVRYRILFTPSRGLGGTDIHLSVETKKSWP